MSEGTEKYIRYKCQITAKQNIILHNNNYKYFCLQLASMQWTLIAVMLSIIVIGLITLLLWKLITTVYDRREYARFENERSMAKWDAVSIK